MQLRFSTVPVVGAILTVLAVLALSVAPAFGQAVAIDEGDDVQYNGVCQNIIGAIGDINAGNTGTATSNANASADAGADDDDATASPEGASADAAAEGTSEANATAESVAEIAQETGVSIEQVNECLNGVDSGSGDKDDGNENGEDEIADEGTEALGDVSKSDDVLADTYEKGVLPVTGGFPLLAGAGLMLLAAIAVGARIIGRR